MSDITGNVSTVDELAGCIGAVDVIGGTVDFVDISEGTVDVVEEISGSIGVDGEISGNLEMPVNVDVPEYHGDYEVTPKMYEQTELATAGKKCTDNITFNRIPQYEVSNTAGGITAIIGDEYYGN